MTYGPQWQLIPDPLGSHITGEYLDPTDGLWYSFHLYVVKENGKWVVNTSQNPNPKYADKPPSKFEKSSPREMDEFTGAPMDREEWLTYTPIQEATQSS